MLFRKVYLFVLNGKVKHFLVTNPILKLIILELRYKINKTAAWTETLNLQNNNDSNSSLKCADKLGQGIL